MKGAIPEYSLIDKHVLLSLFIHTLIAGLANGNILFIEWLRYYKNASCRLRIKIHLASKMLKQRLVYIKGQNWVDSLYSLVDH